MAYKSLQACLLHLEETGQLLRIKEEVDPYLELASIHLRIHEAKGKAILFEKIKGSKYQAASNIFGTIERSKFIFKETLPTVQQLIELKNNPASILKNPFTKLKLGFAAIKSLPKKTTFPSSQFDEIAIADLPLIHHWEKDGGAFITLPQVFTEDIDKPGINNSNLGMYRIQLTGNNYEPNKEIGLHYQLHRGIGVHQAKANAKNQPLKVSVFVGGPPSHSVAAVMPLPEGLSELKFAGVLAGRRFRYSYQDGYCISNDADFIITGEVFPNDNKPEGPFGDHLGYYSLQHPFPVMKIHKVYAKKNAIWPFTVVGRPPQEDTSFGELIHEIAGSALQNEIPGLKEVNAVDAAGVHPLLLAIGSERYTPYSQTKQPAELLTIANHILGTGQLSLAKFLFITADDENKLSTQNIESYFNFILKRIDLKRDVHFYTNTTIDTLDYSGTSINTGSKIVFAAYGNIIRELASNVPACLKNLNHFTNAKIVLPGIVALNANTFINYEKANEEVEIINDELKNFTIELNAVPLILLCDDSEFTSQTLNNFLWVAFTRCNPSHDIYGINSFTQNKHWGCNGSLIIDCRFKPHNAPVLTKNAAIESSVTALLKKYGY